MTRRLRRSSRRLRPKRRCRLRLGPLPRPGTQFCGDRVAEKPSHRERARDSERERDAAAEEEEEEVVAEVARVRVRRGGGERRRGKGVTGHNAAQIGWLVG